MDFFDYRRHFMYSKYQEERAIESMTTAEVEAALESDLQALSQADSFPGYPNALRAWHLRNWKVLFSSTSTES
jgi:hypothetical protein